MSQQEVARATGVMAVGTVLSRLTGFLRIFALAYAIGFIGLGDAYNLANVTPNIVYELVLGGVLSGTLVTLFVRQHTQDAEGAGEALSALVSVALVAMVGLGALLALVAPLVIDLYTAGTHEPAQQVVATTLLRWFAPQVVCLGVITLTTALLNARRRFAAPMFSPVAANLTISAVLFAVPTMTDRLSLVEVVRRPDVLALLGLGTTAGFALQAGIQVAALRGLGLRLRPTWNPRHPLVREVVRLSGWTVGLTVANQVALWVVLLLANRRPAGVSAWQSASVFFQLPYAVVVVSLAAALQPALAEAWARHDTEGYRRDLVWGLRSLTILMAPAGALLAVLAGPLVATALAHGALETTSARTTTDVLAVLAVGLPGFSAFLFCVRAFMAQKDPRSAFLLYVVQNATHVVVAVATFRWLDVRALAVGHVLSYATAAATALVVLDRRLEGGVVGPTAAVAARAAAVAVGSGVVVAAAVAPIGTGGLLGLVKVICGGALGVTVYLAGARVVRLGTVRELLGSGGRPGGQA